MTAIIKLLVMLQLHASLPDFRESVRVSASGLFEPVVNEVSLRNQTS